MIDVVYCLTNLLFFDIPLLYCYISLKLPKMFPLSSGDLYHFLSVSLSCSLLAVSKLLCVKVLEMLSAILLPNKLPVASSVF